LFAFISLAFTEIGSAMSATVEQQ